MSRKLRIKPHKLNQNYKGSNHLLFCPVTGRVIDSKDARKRWDGVWVHKSAWERRQPQDFVRGVQEDLTAHQPVRNQPVDLTTDVTYDPATDDSVPESTFTV